MAAVGTYDGRSRGDAVMLGGSCGHRGAWLALLPIALCVPLSGPARSDEAASTAPAETAADAAPRPPHYETQLLEEASAGQPSVSSQGTSQGSGNAAIQVAAEPAEGAGRARIDAIKAAVSDALAEAQKIAPHALDADATPPQATDSPASRREWLRELVSSTPVPEDEVDADYVGELRDEVAETLVMGEAVAAKPESVGIAATQINKKTPSGKYRVRPGDSLWKIAKDQLGDGYRWAAIYKANRRVLRNANALCVGQLLTLPR